MRRPLIAANWKMNPAPAGAFDGSTYQGTEHVDVWVFPTYVDIPTCVEAKILTGAQYGRPEVNGAFTGDVSMKMLRNLGCVTVLCGHSERRRLHGETDEYVAAQAVAALELGMHPVICIGETKEEREADETEEVLKRQMKTLPLDSDITIAYEPVWAIGTGVSATSEQAQEAHAFIRNLLPKERRKQTRILYGGSMKPANAADLLKQPDIDGGLIGAASLIPADFAELVAMAAKQ